MSLIRLIMVLCALPIYIFSWSWFSNPPPAEKVDFACPHRCGQWGSASIQAIEWQFVQCLYDADGLQRFINHNDIEFDGNVECYKLMEPELIQRPENFQSEWYQKMLASNEYGQLVISNISTCCDGWAAFWRIKHIDQPDRKHLGKIFERKKYNECAIYGVDDSCGYYDRNDDEEKYKHLENDPDWNHCLWENLVEDTNYSFKNHIDFHNACMQVEQDLWEVLQDSGFRGSIERVALFKTEMHARFAKLSLQFQQVRSSYDHIFEECSQLHNAPSACYVLALKQFEKGDYVEAIEAIKSLLNKVKLDSLDANLASHIYSSKGSAEIETLQYDEAILSLSQAINLKPSNPDAYFDRAIAYFETGQFELSLQDYLNQGKDVFFKSYEDDWFFKEFSIGFAKGGVNGVKEASTEFLPSIYNSVAGIGNFLWLTIQHPIDTPKQLVGSTIEFCDYLRTCDKAELAQVLVPEMYELIVGWDKLTHERRGELVGYSLGKYGLDILLPVASVKGLKYVKTFHDIKRAEKLGMFQTLAKSAESKEALYQAAAEWKRPHEINFANVKLVKDSRLPASLEKLQSTGIYEKNLNHIFRNASGHLPDTLQNRKLLINTASNPKNYLGKDRFGNVWHAEIQKDGTEIWTISRNGQIRNGGMNQQPKLFKLTD